MIAEKWTIEKERREEERKASVRVKLCWGRMRGLALSTQEISIAIYSQTSAEIEHNETMDDVNDSRHTAGYCRK